MFNLDLDILNEDFSGTKEWLQTRRTPWDTVEIKWKATSAIRLHEIKSSIETNLELILKEWPLLKETNGQRLVINSYNT